jgi:hypothetical protein
MVQDIGIQVAGVGPRQREMEHQLPNEGMEGMSKLK